MAQRGKTSVIGFKSIRPFRCGKPSSGRAGAYRRACGKREVEVYQRSEPRFFDACHLAFHKKFCRPQKKASRGWELCATCAALAGVAYSQGQSGLSAWLGNT